MNTVPSTLPETQLRLLDSSAAPVVDLSTAVTDSIRTPLAVLRAALESLTRGMARDDARTQVLQRALGEVIELGKSVQTLVDYALPQPVRPLSCRIEEIAYSALERLTPERRSRVLIAIENGALELQVDAPLLARALANLLEFGLDSTREPVLLTVRGKTPGASFSVVHESHLEQAEGARALGLLLARREFQRLGATAATRRTLGAQLHSEVRFEKARAPKESA